MSLQLWACFFSVDLLVANRISPLLVNMEVAIDANSYSKTGRLLTNGAWIKQVGVVPGQVWQT